MTGFGQTTVSGEVKRTTDDAILFVVNGDEIWVPRSVCLDGSNVEEGDTDLIIANWWAEKECLI